MNGKISNSSGEATPPLTYFLFFLSLILFLTVLKIAGSILIPFALAIFLAFLLYPVVIFLTKLKIPYGLSVAIVMVLVLVLFLWLATILIGELNSLAQALPQYQEGLKDYLNRFLSTVGRYMDKFVAALPGDQQPDFHPPSATTILTNIVSRLFSGLLSAVSLISDFVIIFFMLFFLLADAHIFRTKLINAWGRAKEGKARQIVDAINEGIGKYILIRTLINMGLAVVVTIVLLILDVDYAYIWGPLTGLLNFIPYLGSIVAAVPPLVVALVTHDTYWTAVMVLIAYVIIQNIEGNYITPKLVGRRVNLNSLAVLLSLILWGFIWGPVGMILATPLTTCFKVLCDHIEPLHPIGILLGIKEDGKTNVQ